MRIDVDGNRVAVGERLRDQIEGRLESALSRLDGWVQKATVYLDDVNGPRGGVCKLCRVVVTANGIEKVVVTEMGESVQASTSRAIRRSVSALKRRLKQRRDRKTAGRNRPHPTSDFVEANREGET
jgi:putative sigma-54 modulation protein